MNNGAIIETRELRKTYLVGKVQVPALRGVDLSVPPGEFLSIIGPSGSGKSTLFHIIGGLTPPSSGQVRVGGEDLAKMSDADRTRLQQLYRPYAIWIPRLLGLLVFVFVILALTDTRTNFDDATALEQVAFAISRLKSLIMIASAVALIYFAVVTLRRDDWQMLALCDAPNNISDRQSVVVDVNMQRIHLFDRGTGKALGQSCLTG